MVDPTGIELPWFVELLGQRSSHPQLSRVCTDYALTSTSPAGSPPGWYENAELGVSVYIEHGRIDAIQFFSQPHLEFGGPLTPSFLGVDYGMRQDDIRRLLGEPDETFGARTTGAIRHAGLDRYALGDIAIAFAYAISSGQVESISFERAKRK
ncbi:MAG: hypothetical protein H6712_01025 [Myxococcales bacterium]|nr:hypothetical protein [Myxococcales bacterium]MCB9712406.1 hypothetical protein [Myxococcales bacterium]